MTEFTNIDGIDCIILRHPQIVSFFRDNTTLNASTTVLELVQWMNEITNQEKEKEKEKNGNKKVSVATMSELASSLRTTTDTISTVQTNVTEINRQLQTMKQDYLREISTILANTALNSHDKLSTAIDRNSSQLVDRTTTILSENIPKQQDALRNQIGALFTDLASSLSVTIQSVVSKQSSGSMADLVALVDKRYSETMQEAVAQMESRMTQQLNAVKDESVKTAMVQDRLATSVDDFLAKYGNSSNKGKIGEANLSAVLTKLYPSAECINTTGTSNSGDFRLVRGGDKPTILLENKDYIQNIDKVEVSKFINDVSTHRLSGVFLSQSSGISFKNNYQIDFHGGRVLVYVHNCGYCPEKIRSAIDIIDSLEPKLASIAGGETDHTISGEDLDDINREYQTFLSQKEAMVNMVKDNAKKMTRQIEEMRMPELDRYLRGKYAHVKSRIFTCDLCGLFHGQTKQSLAAHMRCCKRKEVVGQGQAQTSAK